MGVWQCHTLIGFLWGDRMPTIAIVMLLATMGGMGLMTALLRHSHVPPMMRLLGGAVSGFLGAQVFMLPTNYCAFDPEQKLVQTRFGVFLVIVGVIAVTLPLRWALERRYTGKRLLATDYVAGAFKGWWLPIAFLAPTIIILALFLYYPASETFRLSTLLVKFGNSNTKFVCFDNFTRLLTMETPIFPPKYAFLDWVFNEDYAQVVFQTIILGVAIVGFSMSLSLMIALAAFLPLKGASIYRTLLIWPYAISPAVAGIIFLLMFNPLGGIINYLFRVEIGWLNDPNVGIWAVIMVSVWKSLGFNILFFIAGLQNIPKDLIEAAAIDGAGLIQRFRRVVLPLLSPIGFFLLITNLTYAFFETFGTIDYLTNGGPRGSTETMMYRIYDVGVNNQDLGKAAAQSLLLFVMVIGITLVQFRTTGENVNYSA
jgi:sn-glycerol 3-phosphate transport system permease protein